MSRTTKIDYKKELETASKGMIMIHDPRLLIKLIVRMIVTKVDIKHAGMILEDPKTDSYVLTISRGQHGYKIPAGFARFEKNNPIIKLFTEKDYKALRINKNGVVAQDINRMIWQESVIANGNGNGTTKLLHEVADQMRMHNIVACVPGLYRDKLLAVLLLGEKNDGSKFDDDELDFFAALAHDVAMAIRNAQLFENLQQEADKNHDLFLRTVIVLGSTIEAKDKYTHGHSRRVTEYSIAIARQMNENGSGDFSEEFLNQLYIAGMLHDIGKIGVPEAILNNEGKLTAEEFDIMRSHTVYGVEILKPLSELKDSLNGVKYHHERYDGKGYPEGLKGEETPIIAAIIAVADAFDAMTTDRPYRKGLTKEQGIKEIDKHSGDQFHPLPAQAMIELFKAGKLPE